jgi:hypothetical protein
MTDGGSRGEDDITFKLADILKTNNTLRNQQVMILRVCVCVRARTCINMCVRSLHVSDDLHVRVDE